MNREALAVHARLAALPTYRHRSEPVERGPSTLTGYPTEGRKPGRPAPQGSPLRAQVVRKPGAAPAGPKPRKEREMFVITNPKPNQWGFVRGEQLQVADDGKSHAGERVQYIGASSGQWVYVRAAGMKVSVRADRLRRAP